MVFDRLGNCVKMESVKKSTDVFEIVSIPPIKGKFAAFFDMDGTLLAGRSIFVIAQNMGFEEELLKILNNKRNDFPSYVVSQQVVKLLKGFQIEEIKEIFGTILLTKGVKEVVLWLKKHEFISAIVTDSYTQLANLLAKRLGIDIVAGNRLEVDEKGIITGKIYMPLGWEKHNKPGCFKHSVCKLNALKTIAKTYKIPLKRTIAVGDRNPDACMVEAAGLGFAFEPKGEKLEKAADLVIYEDMRKMIPHLEQFLLKF